MLNSIFPVLGRYVTFRPFAMVPAISLAASILRSSIIPKPKAFVASEISRAASDSPSALMTAARRSYTRVNLGVTALPGTSAQMPKRVRIG